VYIPDMDHPGNSELLIVELRVNKYDGKLGAYHMNGDYICPLTEWEDDGEYWCPAIVPAPPVIEEKVADIAPCPICGSMPLWDLEDGKKILICEREQHCIKSRGNDTVKDTIYAWNDYCKQVIKLIRNR